MSATAAFNTSFQRPSVVIRCREMAGRVPVTLGYLSALWLVDLVLDSSSGPARAGVVLRSSTNLVNLTHGHLLTLASSAFVHEGGFITRDWAVLAAVLAAAEWSGGSRRLVAVFVAGHVGATLIVAAGLAAAIALGWTPSSLAHASDVGSSYGVMAVGAALTTQLPRWLRPVWAGCWLVDAGAALLSGRTFTEAGHLIAFVIGLAIAIRWISQSVGEPSPVASPRASALADSLAAVAFTQNAIVIPRVAASAAIWIATTSMGWVLWQMLFSRPTPSRVQADSENDVAYFVPTRSRPAPPVPPSARLPSAVSA